MFYGVFGDVDVVVAVAVADDVSDVVNDGGVSVVLFCCSYCWC